MGSWGGGGMDQLQVSLSPSDTPSPLEHLSGIYTYSSLPRAPSIYHKPRPPLQVDEDVFGEKTTMTCAAACALTVRDSTDYACVEPESESALSPELALGMGLFGAVFSCVGVALFAGVTRRRRVQQQLLNTDGVLFVLFFVILFFF